MYRLGSGGAVRLAVMLDVRRAAVLLAVRPRGRSIRGRGARDRRDRQSKTERGHK